MGTLTGSRGGDLSLQTQGKPAKGWQPLEEGAAWARSTSPKEPSAAVNLQWLLPHGELELEESPVRGPSYLTVIDE